MNYARVPLRNLSSLVTVLSLTASAYIPLSPRTLVPIREAGWHLPVDRSWNRPGASFLHSSLVSPLALSDVSGGLGSATHNFSSDVNRTLETLPEEHAPSSEVEYERALMPRPKRKPQPTNDQESEILSHISWEMVVLAKPKVKRPSNPSRELAAAGLAASGMLSSLLWLISASEPGVWRYYLAGGLCAAISHSVPVPIDVVKTRKQVDPGLANNSFIAAMNTIIEKEGMRSLWAGLGPTALGYLIEGAIKFGVYEATKPMIKKLLVGVASTSPFLGILDSHVLNLVLSGIMSGVAASIALCPMEALRIRLVAGKDTNLNWVKSGIQIVREEGLKALSRGMVPMLYKQIPYTVVKNASFDLATMLAYQFLRSRGQVISTSTKLTIPVLAAALASVLSCISSQPGDMLLSLMNAQAGERRRTRDIVRDILRSDRGIGGFFVGIKTRFLHVGVIVTLQLFLYDVIKRLCGIGATGAH